MADVQHAALRPGQASGIHVIHAWEVTSDAQRTSLPVVANQDEGKVCKQNVAGVVSFWALATVTAGVGTWVRFDNVVTPGAPQDVEYLVAALSAGLTAERALEAKAGYGLAVDYTTPAKAIIDPTNFRPQVFAWLDTAIQNVTPNPATDVGKFARITAEGVAHDVYLYLGDDGGTDLWMRVPRATEVESLSVSITGVSADVGTRAKRQWTVNSRAGNYTLALGDSVDTIIDANTASNITITLPSNATAAIPLENPIPIRRRGTGSVTIAAGSGATIVCARPAPYTIAAQYGEPVMATKTGANEWWLTGGLS